MSKRRRKSKVDWKGHLIDIAKAMIPILILGAVGLYVAMEKMKTQNDANKTYYAEKFDQAEKDRNNMANWMKYISDKLDRHIDKE